jgi:hypothetical protein
LISSSQGADFFTLFHHWLLLCEKVRKKPEGNAKKQGLLSTLAWDSKNSIKLGLDVFLGKKVVGYPQKPPVLKERFHPPVPAPFQEFRIPVWRRHKPPVIPTAN